MDNCACRITERRRTGRQTLSVSAFDREALHTQINLLMEIRNLNGRHLEGRYELGREQFRGRILVYAEFFER